MKEKDLKSMTLDQLWELHEMVTARLSERMTAEKIQLEKRLRSLSSRDTNANRARRPYPKVLAKYRNPQNPSETWAGRGKQPRWLSAQLKSGKKLKDFLISA